MSRTERYVRAADATAARALAATIGRAHAQETGAAYPIPPDYYGPGRQPEPRSSAYQRYYVAPIGRLVPAPEAAVRLSGAAMAGHVDFDELPDADKELIDPDRTAREHPRNPAFEASIPPRYNRST